MTTVRPDFNQMLKVLHKQKPDRPVLFELFMNMPLYERVTGGKATGDALLDLKLTADAFAILGYDYVSAHACDIAFQTRERQHKNTVSLNEGFVITDQKSFDTYKWPDPAVLDYSRLEKIAPLLPEGMKLMVMGPGGVLENVIALVGYDNLCYMLYEDEPLVKAIFDRVGNVLLKYYDNAIDYDSVGFICSNDDWGFNTQTFLSPEQMRKYVFPWHKKIVEIAHTHGKPAILHSCGYMGEVMEDIIEDMRFDGKHSYEDGILPVEESYKKWGGRIAILGGIDVDFLIRRTRDEITARCKNMLELAQTHGGYALGSGNSIPEYIPFEQYATMVECATGLQQK